MCDQWFRCKNNNRGRGGQFISSNAFTNSKTTPRSLFAIWGGEKLAVWLVSVIRIFPAPAGTGAVCSSSPQKHLLGLGVDGPRGDGAWN